MMDPELELPERLRKDLAAVSAPRGEVSEEVERAILAAAPVAPAIEASARRRSRPTLVRAASIAAAAAVIALVGLWWTAGGDQAPADVAVARAEDVDESGRVDVLDALALARRIEGGAIEVRASGAKLDVALDFNADGRIDRADVDHVAREAVRIDA